MVQGLPGSISCIAHGAEILAMFISLLQVGNEYCTRFSSHPSTLFSREPGASQPRHKPKEAFMNIAVVLSTTRQFKTGGGPFEDAVLVVDFRIVRLLRGKKRHDNWCVPT